MEFLNFLLFLIAAFSVSNAALLPVDLSLTSSPLPDALLLGSSLDLPAPGNELSSFDLNLNAIGSDNNPTSSYTPELAQEPEAQPHPDDSNGICYPDSSTGQHRRKRQLTSCPNPAILDFYPNVPLTAQAGGTKLSEKEKKLENLRTKDITWLMRTFRQLFGSNEWMQKTSPELQDRLLWLSDSEEDSCAKQSVPEGRQGSYPRRFSLCCIGPKQVLTVPSIELRLARRQNLVRITNWFNCQLEVMGRPFCEFFQSRDLKSESVCCREFSMFDTLGLDPADWWEWGGHGQDCVRHLSS